ncbi:MAG TPA: xanthine dehydrogenase family protein subunit M [Pyrinomonadaceae bacterium]|nr:xanthine dehydrogenase family protein subunit M [Pyrinomonadaceae bacterium]
MRAYLPAYELVVPRTLEEALGFLGEGAGVWRPFAGGTDLMVLLEAGRLAHRKFFSVWHLDELRGIEVSDTHVTLGALVTYSDVQASEVLRREFPSLCRAASETGGWAIQNRGTLGGNIANASPAADSPPALLAHGAELELVSAAGSRTVGYADFHTGYKQTVMRPDELIARIRLPRPAPGAAHFYRKVGTRRAQAISKVCLAGLAETEGGVVREVRLAVGSVAPTVVRCLRTEEVLKGRAVNPALAAEASAALVGEINPIDDIRSTARYRARVAQNLLEEFLSQLSPPSRS